MTRKRLTLVGVLGPSPLAFDSVLSGLVRAHRFLDADDEERQHAGHAANRERDATLKVISTLMDWMQPSVDLERAGWDAANHGEVVLGYIDPSGKGEGNWAESEWQKLRDLGYDETELRAAGGDR